MCFPLVKFPISVGSSDRSKSFTIITSIYPSSTAAFGASSNPPTETEFAHTKANTSSSALYSSLSTFSLKISFLFLIP